MAEKHERQVLEQKGLNDLRKMLRAEHPECRGAFAANCLKDEAIRILTGECDAQRVIDEYVKRISSTSTSSEPAVVTSPETKPEDGGELAEGAHGEGAPADGAPVVPANTTADTEKVLAALENLAPEVARKFRDMEAELTKTRERRSRTEPKVFETAAAVQVMGVDCPLVCMNGDERMPYVPDTNDFVGYRPDLWHGARAAGAVEFRQTADDLIKLILHDERVMLVGPPSVGKTSIVTWFAAWTRWPLVRFNSNRDVTVPDFVGCYEARGGETVWVDGPLPRAMKMGAILVLDEVDHMPAECSSILHSVLEHGGKLMITGNGGEIVTPAEGFRIVATANTSGFGDETGTHPNAQVQDAAFLSRFDVVLAVDWFTPEQEAELLAELNNPHVSDDDCKKIAQCAADSREAVKRGEMLYPVTLRQTMAWCRRTPELGLGTAFCLAVLNKLPPSDAEAMAEIAQRHFGNAIGNVTGEQS